MSTQALSAPVSSLSLLLVQTQTARWKAATPEQLTGAHLYLAIAKSGYPFHAIKNVMDNRLFSVEKQYIPRKCTYFHFNFFCHHLVLTDFTHILQGYLTGTASIETFLHCCWRRIKRYGTLEECATKDHIRPRCQKQVYEAGISNYHGILWDAVTYPCRDTCFWHQTTHIIKANNAENTVYITRYILFVRGYSWYINV